MGRSFSRRGKRLLLKRVLPVGVALTVCTCCAYVVNSAQYNNHFLPGTIINGIDVSDKTVSEAAEILRTKKADYSITLKFRDGAEAELNANDLALDYQCSDELQQLMNEQNRHEWLTRELGSTCDETLQTKYTVDRDALVESLKTLPELQEGNYQKPENADLRLSKDFQFKLIPEVEGTQLDEEALADEAAKAILGEKSVLDLTRLKDVYKEPQVRADDAELVARRDQLNKLLSAEVSIKLSDGSLRKVDASSTVNWVSVDSEGRYQVNEDAVLRQAKRIIAEIAAEDDNYGYYRSFKSTNYGMQKFDSENLHGHTLNQERMAATLAEMLIAGRSGTINPVYTQMVDTLDPRFGGTYVEIDIYEQHVYYYQDYELVYDCNCVTGTEGYSSTPSGIFDVDEKIRGRELEGYRSDGSLSYSVHVDYWIRFIPHYGLHDASWRDSFGGNLYEYDGSHGCVNLPTSAAATLYDLVDYGTPVIVLRGQVESRSL